MFGFRLFHKKQPQTKKRVFEFGVSNFISAWLLSRNWGAMTFPLPFFVVILYWHVTYEEDLDALERVHEFVHVAQDEANANVIVTWWNYFWEEARRGYSVNKYEVAAYAVEADAQKNGLPDWAK